MTTEDSIRAALHRHAATHSVNAALPQSTITKARVSRFAAIAGVAALVVALAAGGVAVVDLTRRGPTTIAPGSEPDQEEGLRETSGGAPLLLVTEEGWRVTRADQFDADTGELAFKDGTHEMALSWRAADTHQSFVEDRQNDAGDSWDVTITGRPATLIRYEGTTDFTALWLDGSKSLELRGEFPTLEDYLAIAETLEFVDQDTWFAALPKDTVRPSERPLVVDTMLADVPVHPSIDVDELERSPFLSNRYQLGQQLTGDVSCAWIKQWVDATTNGGDEAAQDAVDAMKTSRRWAILQEMDSHGGWSEVVWEYADAMAGDGAVTFGSTGPLEESYEIRLGCEGFENGG
jgi:hypothetical protein